MAVLWYDGRMNLDLFDVREGCADLFGKVKAFAECTGMVRGREAFEFGAVLFNHGVVCTEAACGQHDRLGVDGFGSLCRLDLDAGDRAVLHQNVDDLMVLEDFDLVGLESGGQNAKNFRPDGGAVTGAVTARNGLTATAALAEAELGAEIDKPFLRISCVFRERLQERGIVEVVTAFHRVLIEDFRTVVRDAACDLLLRARCVHASRGEVGVAADVGRTTTLEPASLAMMAAERPAPPEPTTTTSKDWASETAAKRASTVPATRVFLYIFILFQREKWIP